MNAEDKLRELLESGDYPAVRQAATEYGMSINDLARISAQVDMGVAGVDTFGLFQKRSFCNYCNEIVSRGDMDGDRCFICSKRSASAGYEYEIDLLDIFLTKHDVKRGLDE